MPPPTPPWSAPTLARIHAWATDPANGDAQQTAGEATNPADKGIRAARDAASAAHADLAAAIDAVTVRLRYPYGDDMPEKKFFERKALRHLLDFVGYLKRVN